MLFLQKSPEISGNLRESTGRMQSRNPVNAISGSAKEALGKVTILWKILLKSEDPVENTAESPSERATESPGVFPRCRFLACDLLSSLTAESAQEQLSGVPDSPEMIVAWQNLGDYTMT